jgi:tetratricopeptide (TPR) repeat protein
MLEDSLKICEELDNRPEMIDVIGIILYNDYNLGLYEEGIALADKAIDIALAAGLKSRLALILRCRAQLKFGQGDLEGSEQNFDQAMTLFKVLGNNHQYASALDGLTMVALKRGDRENALVNLTKLLELVKESGFPQHVLSILKTCVIVVAPLVSNVLASELVATLRMLMRQYAYPEDPLEKADLHNLETNCVAVEARSINLDEFRELLSELVTCLSKAQLAVKEV